MVPKEIRQQQAFESLKRHAIPFQGDQVSADGKIMHVDGFGPIRQYVDPDRLSIVNMTTPEHILHPGNVFRTIVPKGDDLYVVTEGYGAGILPTANEKGKFIWSEPDHHIRHELNPYETGYPMDEMNAVARASHAVRNATPPAPLPAPDDNPELRIPRPIFFLPY